MPYSKQHKQETRAKVVESARILFNRHGFDEVSIDQVMKFARLTRGGFYNHFKSKDELYSNAVSSFLMGRGAAWRDEAGIDINSLNPEMARQMLKSYL
jgi:TetR/AcrR family transcriptional repressor of nem operon